MVYSSKEIYQNQIEDIKKSGLYKEEWAITSSQAVNIDVLDDENKEKNILNLCANNYLGLSNNNEIIEAAKESLSSKGYGMSSVRFICGTQDIHKELEYKLSQFLEKEDSILFASAFDANTALFEAILTDEDELFSDKLVHASLIDGMRLCKAKKQIYEHSDMEDLENKLSLSKARIKMIVTDGVFSMDGDIAKLDEISKLAEEYEALLMVDDAHGEGVLGDHGRGIVNHFGLSDKEVDIDIGSLSKAVGVVGGYIAGSNTLIDYMQQKGRPYLFSSALTVPDVAATIAAINLILRDDSLVNKLWENTEYFQKAVKEIGFDIGRTQTPITPIMIGEVKKSAEFSKKLFDDNIFATSLGFPTVPQGLARVRVMLSAAHSIEDLDFAIEKFEKVGKKLQII